MPKCLSSVGSEVDSWTDSVPSLLARCRNLPPWAVVPTGSGHFAASAPLLSWWASYYSLILTRAISQYPLLRYESSTNRQAFLRGRINWTCQVSEWASGGNEFVCDYKTLNDENVVNQLLAWAATKFLSLTLPSATRTHLQEALEILPLGAKPDRRAVGRIRLTRAFAVYRDPVAVAKALFNSDFPSLTPGGIPASGLVLDMVTAFEAFVDGLVYSVARLGRERNRIWLYEQQRQAKIASSLAGTNSDYFTRPDNAIDFGGQFPHGVVIDAKYKGMTKDLGRPYDRPMSSDLYQIIASCLARGWRFGIVVAPSTKPGAVEKPRHWRVSSRSLLHDIKISEFTSTCDDYPTSVTSKASWRICIRRLSNANKRVLLVVTK